MTIINKISVSLCLFLICVLNETFANETVSLDNVLDKYSSFKVVRMETTKEVYSDLLGKTKKYEGEIYLSKGKFRWDIRTPEKSYLIFDGSTIWSVQHPSDSNFGKIQVTISNSKSIKNHVLISALFDKDILKAKFKITSSKENKIAKFELVPNSSVELNTKKVEFVVDLIKSEILSINYLDEIGNKTNIKVSKTEFTNTLGKKLYFYKAPKGAQVTYL